MQAHFKEEHPRLRKSTFCPITERGETEKLEESSDVGAGLYSYLKWAYEFCSFEGLTS